MNSCPQPSIGQQSLEYGQIKRYTMTLSLPVISVRFLVLSKAIAVREGLFANIALEPLPDVVFAVPSQLFLA